MALPPGFLDRLRALAGADAVSTDAADLATYGRDWTTVHAPAASAVVWPACSRDVAAVLAECGRSHAAVVPSGGRTGLAGGAVASAGEVVLSLERMRAIHPVDTLGSTVRVEAGAITEAVHQACAPHGLTWPIDFASKGSSTIGGNIATNAGGVKVIRYGLTRRWVLGLTVALMDGRLLELGGALEKNNTGIDLRQLFIGSEGILGVVTEAVLKLAPLPGRLDVLVFAVPDLARVVGLFRELRTSNLEVSAYEFFTDRCLARILGHRALSVPFERRAPCYVLCEIEGAERRDVEAWAQSVFERDLADDGVIAESKHQAAELWQLREGISESLTATGKPHKNDVALPVAALEAFVADLERVFEERYPAWEICNFGHIGDGNLHINVMKPDDMPAARFHELTHEADHAMFELVAKHGGSISAEHGIGLLKRDFLGYTRSADEIALMRAMKAAFDPAGLLNPGKIFP